MIKAEDKKAGVIMQKLEAKTRILFTEGTDPRVLHAAQKLIDKNVLHPIVYGKRDRIKEVASKEHLDIRKLEILDPDAFADKEQMLLRMLELRKGKADRKMAEEWIQKDTYFCTMYVEMGYADGLLGGSTNSTADTLRPIMQLVKTKPGCSFMSSCFLMLKKEQRLIFADCSMNRNPNVDQLVEITLQSAESAKAFGLTPKVALLSYSSKGSGSGIDVDLVRETAIRLSHMPWDYIVDGELQVDCALNPQVAELKAPNSPIKGEANVLIFPDLNSGNIGYKLVANLGGYEALGPILQGVRLPMNDLSRSASIDEIYKMAIITAMQKER